jgi:ketosteroid isomerase-like protein
MERREFLLATTAPEEGDFSANSGADHCELIASAGERRIDLIKRESTMYRWIVSVTFALLLCHVTAAAKCSLRTTESLLRNKDPQVLKEVEQEWLQAYGEKNMSVLDCILADDFEIASMPDKKGEAHNKKHVLDWVAQRPRTVQKIEQFELKRYGDVAIARGIYSMNGPDEKVLARYQFMDVFIYREERWQALTREIAELPVK